jgi:hypothetical protein
MDSWGGVRWGVDIIFLYFYILYLYIYSYIFISLHIYICLVYLYIKTNHLLERGVGCAWDQRQQTSYTWRDCWYGQPSCMTIYSSLLLNIKHSYKNEDSWISYICNVLNIFVYICLLLVLNNYG